MAETYVQVPPNSTGAKIRANSRTVGSDTVEEQVVIGTDADGNQVFAVAADDSVIYIAGVAKPIKYAKIAAASNGSNELVAAVTSKKIRLISYNFIGSGAVNAKFQSASTDKSGLKYIAAAGGGICAPFNPGGWLETASGEALNLNLSGAVAVGGELSYIEV
jgi:hypothetical protein